MSILNVRIGSYDKPVATLSNGYKITLNTTNTRALIKDVGPDSAQWVGHTVELSLGEITYQGQSRETVLLRVLDPVPPDQQVKDVAPDIGDEVPF